MKKIFVVFLAFVMTVTTLVGCGVNKKDLYDPANNEISLGNLFFVEDAETIPEENNITSEKEYFDSLCGTFTEIQDLDNDYINNLKSRMIEFFHVNYGIDVAQKVKSVETKLITMDNNLIMGYHEPGTNVVYVNKEIYDKNRDYFPFTWCHEVIHMLGLNYDDNVYWALYETITEAVNFQLIGWMEAPFNMSAYVGTVMVGEQMIIANPELVTRSFMDEEFKIEDHINEVLKDAEYPVAKLPEDTQIAYQLNAYLMCVIEENDLYFQGAEIFNFMIQQITTAYCRKFNLDEEKIEISKTLWLIEDFDKVTIKSSGRGLELKR